MSKKILIFGANGRLGQHIVSKLNDEYQITAVDIQEQSTITCGDYRQLTCLEDVGSLYSNNLY